MELSCMELSQLCKLCPHIVKYMITLQILAILREKYDKPWPLYHISYLDFQL